MELNAFSIRERAKVGKENYKLEDLKKVEMLIEAAADRGAAGVEVRYSDLGNLHEHYRFIAADLRTREFNVTEQLWGKGESSQIDYLWITWN